MDMLTHSTFSPSDPTNTHIPIPSFTSHDTSRAMHHHMHAPPFTFSQHSTHIYKCRNSFTYFNMAIQNQEVTTFTQLMKQKYLAARQSSKTVSFSAELPPDIGAALRERCVCAVKYSANPLSDIRFSIVEMIQKMGIRDWEEMEELIYCYIVLNSSDLRHFIQEAFLSIRFSKSS